MEVREGVALNRSFSFAALIVFAPTESSQIAYRGWDSQVSKSARPGPPGRLLAGEESHLPGSSLSASAQCLPVIQALGAQFRRFALELTCDLVIRPGPYTLRVVPRRPREPGHGRVDRERLLLRRLLGEVLRALLVPPNPVRHRALLGRLYTQEPTSDVSQRISLVVEVTGRDHVADLVARPGGNLPRFPGFLILDREGFRAVQRPAAENLRSDVADDTAVLVNDLPMPSHVAAPFYVVFVVGAPSTQC